MRIMTFRSMLLIVLALAATLVLAQADVKSVPLVFRNVASATKWNSSPCAH
jgi:hypothetical protein